MKTLYTGHITVGANEVYSFIYAETLLNAEEYLATLLNCYLRQYYNPLPHVLPQINIVSRPDGWIAPDGYILPATSKQYALRYPSQKMSSPPQEVDATFDDSTSLTVFTPETILQQQKNHN
jgi:hypothetical protein